MGRIARDWSTRLSHHTLQYDEKVVIYCMPSGKKNYHRYAFPGYFRGFCVRFAGLESGQGSATGDGYSGPPTPKAVRSQQPKANETASGRTGTTARDSSRPIQ